MSSPAPRAESEKRLVPVRSRKKNRPQRQFQENFSPRQPSPRKRWITEQYDTSVRTNTLAGPGASDAAVVRIKESEKEWRPSRP